MIRSSSTPTGHQGGGSHSTSAKFGPYLVGQTLGRGSFGKVKAAVHATTGHRVALKVISRKDIDALADEGEAGREKATRTKLKLLREIRTLRLLGSHPHITKLYDVVRTRSGDTVFVLELVEGGDLYEYLTSRGPLTEDAARHFFQQLVSAVATAHVFGVCHRDIKPENILLYTTHATSRSTAKDRNSSLTPTSGGGGADDDIAIYTSESSSSWMSSEEEEDDNINHNGVDNLLQSSTDGINSRNSGSHPNNACGSASPSLGRSPVDNISFSALGTVGGEHHPPQPKASTKASSKKPAYLNQGIKLGDFGLASVAHDGKLFETSCGTPNYAAPEVVSGRLYDGKEVDVWSCGVVLFTMVTGCLPFDDDDLPSLFRKIQTATFMFPDEPAPLSEKERTQCDQKQLQQRNLESQQRGARGSTPLIESSCNSERLPPPLPPLQNTSFGSEPVHSSCASPLLVRHSAEHPSSPMQDSHPYDATPPLCPRQPPSPIPSSNLQGIENNECRRKKAKEEVAKQGVLTPSLRHLIRRMLCTDPLRRATMEEVLRHPWTLGYNTVEAAAHDTPFGENHHSAVPPYLVAALNDAKEEQQMIFPHLYQPAGAKTLSTSPKDEATQQADVCMRTASDVARHESEARIRARDNFRSLIDLDVVVALCEKFRKSSRTIIDTLIHYEPVTATQSKHPISGGEVPPLAKMTAASPRHTLVDHKLLRSANIYIPSADDALRSTEHDIIVSYSMLVDRKRDAERQRDVAKWLKQRRREQQRFRKPSWVRPRLSASASSTGGDGGMPTLSNMPELLGGTPVLADDLSNAAAIKAPTLTMNVSLREGLLLLGKEQRRAKAGVDPSSPEGRIRAAGGSFYGAPSYSDRLAAKEPARSRKPVTQKKQQLPSGGGRTACSASNSFVDGATSTSCGSSMYQSSTRFPLYSPKVQMTRLLAANPAAAVPSVSKMVPGINGSQTVTSRKSPMETLSQYVSSSPNHSERMASFQLPPSLSGSSCPLPRRHPTSVPVTPQSTQGIGPMFPPLGVSPGVSSSNHPSTPFTATTPQHGPAAHYHFDPEDSAHHPPQQLDADATPLRASLLHPPPAMSNDTPRMPPMATTYPMAPPGTLSLTLLEACGNQQSSRVDAFDWAGALGQSVASLHNIATPHQQLGVDESYGSFAGVHGSPTTSTADVLDNLRGKPLAEQLPYHLIYYDQVNANQWLKALGLPHYSLSSLPNPFNTNVDGLGRLTSAPYSSSAPLQRITSSAAKLITPQDEGAVYNRLFNRVMTGLPYGVHSLDELAPNSTMSTEARLKAISDSARRIPLFSSGVLFATTPPGAPLSVQCAQDVQEIVYSVLRRRGFLWKVLKPFQLAAISSPSGDGTSVYSQTLYELTENNSLRSVLFVPGEGPWPLPPPQTKLFIRILKAPMTSAPLVCAGMASSTPSKQSSSGGNGFSTSNGSPTSSPISKAQQYFVVHIRLSDRCVSDFASIALAAELLDAFTDEADLRHSQAFKICLGHQS